MAVKRAILRRRLDRSVFEHVLGRRFAIWPGVFNPVVFRSGRYIAEFVAQTPLLSSPNAGATALDMGTGCGILAVFAALRGFQVTAVDAIPEAVSCARANAILNHVQDRIEVISGDLFEPVAGRTFDLVVTSLPKFRGPPQTPFERTWRSPDVIDRFAAGLPAVMKPGGVALVVLTSHGDYDGMLSGLAKAGLAVERLTWRHFGVETMAIYGARLPQGQSAPVQNRSSNASQSKSGAALLTASSMAFSGIFTYLHVPSHVTASKPGSIISSTRRESISAGDPSWTTSKISDGVMA
ncbi:MAG: 50S ribosomal protein L11 methyltransferase [Alphaproteobacteria bacterium]|nr:50S ribosomal protein L11 methyltransferase [Alphaproteobacteria bacterium]